MRKIGFFLRISLFWLVLSALSDGISTLFLPAKILEMGEARGQASLLGWISFAGLLAGMLVQPAAGAWSDRTAGHWGRRGGLAAGALVALAALAILGLSSGIIGLALGYLLVQVGLSVAQAAQQGIVPDQVPERDRGKASGFKSFMDIGGALIGFVLLGQLLGQGQAGLAAACMGAILLVGLALAVLLVREPRGPAGPPRQAGGSLRSIFRVDWRGHPRFTALVLSRFFFLLGTYAVGRFLLLYVGDRLALGPEAAAEAAGGLLAGLALVTVLAALPAGWAADRLGRRPVMLFGALASALGVSGYLFAGSLAEIFAFGSLLSLGSAAYASANWAMTADVVPAREAARYFGIANFGTAGASAAAGLLGGLVDMGSGFSPLFLAAALAFGISAACLKGVREDGARGEGQEIPITVRMGDAAESSDAHSHD